MSTVSLRSTYCERLILNRAQRTGALAVRFRVSIPEAPPVKSPLRLLPGPRFPAGGAGVRRTLYGNKSGSTLPIVGDAIGARMIIGRMEKRRPFHAGETVPVKDITLLDPSPAGGPESTDPPLDPIFLHTFWPDLLPYVNSNRSSFDKTESTESCAVLPRPLRPRTMNRFYKRQRDGTWPGNRPFPPAP